MTVPSAPDFSPTPPNPDTPPSFFVKLVASLIRHGLTGIGGLLVGWHVILPAQSDALITDGIGASAIIAGLVWSAIEKYGSSQ